MTTRRLVMLSAAIEGATGIALIADPGLVVRVLLSTDLAGGGVVAGRIAGFGLLSLGVACWSDGDRVTAQAVCGLFTYNLLTALYLGYLRMGGVFVSFLLWPAFAVHALLAVLLARPAYERLAKNGLTYHPGLPVPKVRQ